MDQPHFLFLRYCLLIFCIHVVIGQELVPEEWKKSIASNDRLFSTSLLSFSRAELSPLLVPSIGNGYLATVVGSPTIFISGLFNGKNHNGLDETPVSHRARIPSFLNVNITGAEIEYTEKVGETVKHHPGGFAIDTKEGVFYERLFIGNENKKAQIEQRRYCHRRYSSLIIHEIHIDNSISTFSEEISLNFTQLAGPMSKDIEFSLLSKNDELMQLRGQILQPELEDSLQVKVGVVFSKAPANLTVLPNERKTVTLFLTARTNIPGDKLAFPEEEPSQAARRDYEEAKKKQKQILPYQKITPLMKEHIEEWENTIWKRGNIKIEGNDELAKVVQSSFYWILLSTREDWPWSLSPGSLASNAYNGHAFWDCETWMFPSLLYFYPEIAESLLQYRFNTLEGAKAKARGYNHCDQDDMLLFDCIIWPVEPQRWNRMSLGYQMQLSNIVRQLKENVIEEDHMIQVPFKSNMTNPSHVDNSFQGNCNYKGALFAWESGFTGSEVCPCMAGGTCLHEHHISGDIAFAVYQYWQATHNRTWLHTIGFPLAYQIAAFWESRVDFENSQFHIRQVIPPDEDALGVTDSVYTNVIAKYSFHIAEEFGRILSFPTPETWSTIARDIKIPFDERQQMHLEYEGFKSDIIKQADVVLLGYPLSFPMSHFVRENDLNFYSSITSEHGPAMTWSVTAIGYVEVLAFRRMEESCGIRSMGEQEEKELFDKANFYFHKSYQNAQPPYYIWTETPNGGAYNFITGAGGFLQGVIAGFGGIRLQSDGIHIIYPLLPENTTSLDFEKINYLDNEFDIQIKEGQFSVVARKLSKLPIVLEEIDFCSEENLVKKIHYLEKDLPLSFPSMTHLRVTSLLDEEIHTEHSKWFGRKFLREGVGQQMSLFFHFVFGALVGFFIMRIIIR